MKRLWNDLFPTPSVFGWKLLRAAPWLIAFAALTMWLEHIGVLTPFSEFGFDSFSMLRGERSATNVRIVDIDDDAYKILFRGSSPLKPQALHDVIDWVERAEPRVVAVDIRTGDPSYAAMHQEPSWKRPIVWAQEIAADNRGCKNECSYHALPVLGGTFHASPDQCARGTSCTGVPTYIKRGGITRQYTRRLPFDGVTDRVTLAWGVVELSACLNPGSNACREAVRRGDEIGFIPLQPTAPLEWPHVLGALKLRDYASTRGWKTHSELRGQIVVIGGSYAGEDRHTIPGAEVTGSWLNAQIIENELGPPLHELPWFLDPALDLVLGVVLVYVLYRLSFVPALVTSGALVLCILFVSFAVFGRLNVWLDWVPIVFGVTLHEFQEHFSDYFRLRMEEEEASRRRAGEGSHQ